MELINNMYHMLIYIGSFLMLCASRWYALHRGVLNIFKISLFFIYNIFSHLYNYVFCLMEGSSSAYRSFNIHIYNKISLFICFKICFYCTNAMCYWFGYPVFIHSDSMYVGLLFCIGDCMQFNILTCILKLTTNLNIIYDGFT